MENKKIIPLPKWWYEKYGNRQAIENWENLYLMKPEPMKKIYNIYKNDRGQSVPKAAVIKNSEEVRNWVKEQHIEMRDSKTSEIGEWCYIAMGVSHIGNLYPTFTTCNKDFFERYIENNNYFKIFDEDFESFKKYVMWARNVPKNIVNNIKNI